jgi:hypothetical protein
MTGRSIPAAELGELWVKLRPKREERGDRSVSAHQRSLAGKELG